MGMLRKSVRFGSRTVVVEAIQFDGSNGREIEVWSGEHVVVSPVLELSESNPAGVYLQIVSTEDPVQRDTAVPGDWVVRNWSDRPSTELFVLKNRVFEKLFYSTRTNKYHPEWDDEPVHSWFSLSYARYLTIPRSVLQSMPLDWQRRFVDCLCELDDAIDWHPGVTGQYSVQLRNVFGRFVFDPLADYERGRRRIPLNTALSGEGDR